MAARNRGDSAPAGTRLSKKTSVLNKALAGKRDVFSVVKTEVGVVSKMSPSGKATFGTFDGAGSPAGDGLPGWARAAAAAGTSNNGPASPSTPRVSPVQRPSMPSPRGAPATFSPMGAASMPSPRAPPSPSPAPVPEAATSPVKRSSNQGAVRQSFDTSPAPASPSTPRASPSTPRAATPRTSDPPRPSTPRLSASKTQGSTLRSTSASALTASPGSSPKSGGGATPRAFGESTGSFAGSPVGSPSRPQRSRSSSRPSRNRSSGNGDEMSMVATGSMNSRRGADANLAGKGNRVGRSVFNDKAGVDSTKWQHWQKLVDTKSIGGHFAPIVRELPSAMAAADPDQQDHDARHADQLHNRRPEEPAHPRASDPSPPALTAFADRAVRLREGRHMRATMMHNDPVPSTWGQHSGPCPCQVCNPQYMHAAGVPCHSAYYNKEPKCNRDVVEPLPFWEAEQAQIRNAQHSSQVNLAMTHSDQVSAPHEDVFKKSLGCKVKANSGAAVAGVPSGMLSHRSAFGGDASPTAGSYNQERYGIFPESRALGRQGWQPKAGDEPPRSGVAMVLSPRLDDPPVPSKVSCSLRAEGTFKHGYSSDAARLAQDRNQEMFRFLDPKSPRGKSLPPKAWDPKEYAGQASGAPLHHTHDTGNPLTHVGKESAYTPLTPRRATSRETRSFRTGGGNDSSAMSFLMDHERIENGYRQEKMWRMQNDEDFKRVVAHTTEEIMSARTRADMNKDVNGHHTSSLMKTQLAWE